MHNSTNKQISHIIHLPASQSDTSQPVRTISIVPACRSTDCDCHGLSAQPQFCNKVVGRAAASISRPDHMLTWKTSILS